MVDSFANQVLNDFRELKIGNLATYQANLNLNPDKDTDVSYVRDDTLHLSFDLLEVRIKQDGKATEQAPQKPLPLEPKKSNVLSPIGEANIKQKPRAAVTARPVLEDEEEDKPTDSMVDSETNRAKLKSASTTDKKLQLSQEPPVHKALGDVISRNKLTELIDHSELESLFGNSHSVQSLEDESRINERLLEILVNKIQAEKEHRRQTEIQIEKLVLQNKRQIQALEKLLTFKRPSIS